MKSNPKLDPPTLEGSYVLLQPISMGDVAELSKVTVLETFQYFVSPTPTEQSEAGFQTLVQYMLETPSIQGFIIRDPKSHAVIGSTSFLDIRPEDDHIEIGMTWYAREWRGTQVNPECKLLMLTYAFDVLKCERVTLKCDARNEHSKHAILKIGAKLEGTLRKHRRTSVGYMRDTTYFSILQEEWSEVKSQLNERLAGIA
ncbi:MAG: GNAT family protein [Armatimonadota bacterium]